MPNCWDTESVSKYTRQAPFLDGRMLDYAPRYYEKVEMRDVEPWTSTMKIVGMESGRSAKHLVVEDEDGQRYTMFVKDFIDMIGEQPFTRRWAVSKRGQNYGIKAVPDES